MKVKIFQCSWCGLKSRNGLDLALHIFTTHYHMDGAINKKDAKRMLRNTIPYVVQVNDESIALICN